MNALLPLFRIVASADPPPLPFDLSSSSIIQAMTIIVSSISGAFLSYFFGRRAQHLNEETVMIADAIKVKNIYREGYDDQRKIMQDKDRTITQQQRYIKQLERERALHWNNPPPAKGTPAQRPRSHRPQRQAPVTRAKAPVKEHTARTRRAHPP